MTGDAPTLGAALQQRGISRRALLKYAGWMASLMALPPSAAAQMAEGLARARRQAVIWLSFQECTGCTESLTRSFSPSLEDLIFDFISLDYHHTLQAASGEAAEEARRRSMRDNKGRYLVVVDGSVPTADGGVYSTIAGQTNLAILAETVADAAAVIAVGTCAAFGGLPHAQPNPTGAVAIDKLVAGKPVINIPGCPPLPQAMAGTITQLLAFGKLPELPLLPAPVLPARPVREELRRRGRAQGLVPVRAGLQGAGHAQRLRHVEVERRRVVPGCIGCSEPGFWDMGGLYRPLATGTRPLKRVVPIAAAGGVALGAGSALLARKRLADAAKAGAKT